jgi:hypothetical protein
LTPHLGLMPCNMKTRDLIYKAAVKIQFVVPSVTTG